MEMCATVEKYAKKYADKREAERIVRTVNSLIEKYNFSFQEACQTAHITMKGYEKYRRIAMPDKLHPVQQQPQIEKRIKQKRGEKRT